MIRYDTVYLRALKGWRYGQLSLAHGTETKKEGKTENKKPSSLEETVQATKVREGRYFLFCKILNKIKLEIGQACSVAYSACSICY